MPRRRVFAATAGTPRPAWVGALANFAEMGTRDYPPLVRRRLMIVNVMAYLIAVFSLIYAALFAFFGLAAYFSLIVANLILVAVALLAPLAHRFSDHCASEGTSTVVRKYREGRRVIPGFGHEVYRSVDPRCQLLMDAVRVIDRDGERMAVVDDVIAEVGRTLPHPPNIDVALGALTWVAGLDPDIPIFAIARIAGWAAHYAEELDERAVRFRGLARRP